MTDTRRTCHACARMPREYLCGICDTEPFNTRLPTSAAESLKSAAEILEGIDHRRIERAGRLGLSEDVRAVVDEPAGYAATSILDQVKLSNVFSVGVPMRTGEAPGFEPLYRRQHKQFVTPDKYDEVLLPFLAMMRTELHANAHKGDRPGWLSMDRKTAVLEVLYHMGKLHQAVHRDEAAAIREYAADVANMCMMLTDVCGCLDEIARLNK